MKHKFNILVINHLKSVIRWQLVIYNIVQTPPLPNSNTAPSPQKETHWWSPPHPAPGNYESTFCLYGFASSGCFKSYNMCLSVCGFFH